MHFDRGFCYFGGCFIGPAVDVFVSQCVRELRETMCKIIPDRVNITPDDCYTRAPLRALWRIRVPEVGTFHHLPLPRCRRPDHLQDWTRKAPGALDSLDKTSHTRSLACVLTQCQIVLGASRSATAITRRDRTAA
jgi:hypothetical protein